MAIEQQLAGYSETKIITARERTSVRMNMVVVRASWLQCPGSRGFASISLRSTSKSANKKRTRLIALLAFMLLPMGSPDVRAERLFGGKPETQTYSSLAPCSAATVGAVAAVSDSTTRAVGSAIAGGGNYHVRASCEAMQGGGAYAWVVADSSGSGAHELNVRSLGFKGDGSDNAPLVAALNSAIHAVDATGTPGAPVVFPLDPSRSVTNYFFTQPLDLTRDGSRVGTFPRVNLVFYPGVEGVRFENRGTAMDGAGVGVANLMGCSIVNIGFSTTASNLVTAGNPDIPIPRAAFPGQIARGVDSSIPEPKWAIGDALVAYPSTTQQWCFTGSVPAGGNVLTVSTEPKKWIPSNDPGIASGQMLLGSPGGRRVPYGVFIAAGHAQNPNYTGTGGTGTYLLSENLPNGVSLSGSMCTWTQNLAPVVPPGTTVAHCTHASGYQCPFAAGHTLTLSNAPTVGQPLQVWMLPGPNTQSPAGSQQYSVTTSRTGGTYGPIKAAISDRTLTVTKIGSGTLNLGQTVIGINGGNVSTTTTAELTVGEHQNIAVNSCTGISAGMYVVGFAGDKSVFPPGATVKSCANGLLAINLFATANVNLTGGSNLAIAPTYYAPAWMFWVGLPVSGNNVPADTTVSSWSLPPFDHKQIHVTLSKSAIASSHGPLNFGGAIHAAPPGTTLTFLNGAAMISALGAGSGRVGTYTITKSANVSEGSTLYFYDTPATIYVTGGPRSLKPQDLLWTDALPFGTISQKVFGTSASKQTVITSTSDGYMPVSAVAAHSAGSGKMWVLPSGIKRFGQGDSYGNSVQGFAVGLNMACMQGEYPETGCGRSADKENFFFLNMIGRYTAGNNSGGSSSQFEQFDHNYLCDICEFASVGSTYVGTMMQSLDESNASQDLVIALCGTNGSPFIGVYMSGSAWTATCLPFNTRMLGTLPDGKLSYAPFIVGSIWEHPYDMTESPIANGVNCSGPPSASFSVVRGVVTHC
jgi:hypothetical protein